MFVSQVCFWTFQLIIVIKATTEQGLRSAESKINAVLSGSRVFKEYPDAKHLETLLNSLMVPSIWPYTNVRVTRCHQITLFLNTKETLAAKRIQGVTLRKPKGTIQKSKFDLNRNTPQLCCGWDKPHENSNLSRTRPSRSKWGSTSAAAS